MAYFEKKLKDLEKALDNWKEILDMPFSEVTRDAAIKRYELAFELLWKTLKLHLDEKFGIKCGSPKGCFREARNPLKLSDEEIEVCLKMTDDRNISVHTYSDKMAKDLYEKTKDYYKMSRKLFDMIVN